MHVFLTGDIRVGKTTIINKFISYTGLSADGFATYWVTDGGSFRSLYLSPYSPYDVELQYDKRHLIARDSKRQPLFSADMVRVFDVHGSEILKNSGKHDVIVMDELGFLETASAIFQRAVMRHISGDVPILGVIKPKQTEFLDTVRAHPNVEICEVTVENREDVLAWLPKRIWRQAGMIPVFSQCGEN